METLLPQQDTDKQTTDFITHWLIKPNAIEQRLYQLNLAAAALKQSTLVVLPTGLGKTIVALIVIANRLHRMKGKVIILSPTKPLVEQHASFLKKFMTLPPDEIVVFTGSIPPTKRIALWKDARVVVSTPQVIENDLLSHRIDLSDVIHITFDEAHRSVGNYAYVYIAEKYQSQAKDPLVLGITASPGASSEKIEEVCRNLSTSNVQVRTDDDPDVKPYVHYRDLEWRHISVPVEIKGLKDSMQRVLDDRVKQLAKLDFIDPNRNYLNKRELLDLQSRLQSGLRSGPDQRVFKAISLVAEILKVSHAIEITETQGPEALAKYFERLEHEAGSKSGSKASRRLVGDVHMRQAMYALKELDVTHPKLEVVKDIVSAQLRNNPDSRVIIFTNYRDMSELVTRNLEGVDNVRPVRFVGQASKYKDTGLTQKQQVAILDQFRSGEYNALVATSVAEEGLDIPATDLVLFYEPVPSEIRSIQRKGRTGRSHAGKVVVLVAKGTKDEAYYWSSRRKEKTMNSKMRQLSDTRNVQPLGETLGIFGTGTPGTPGTLGTLGTVVPGTPEQSGLPEQPAEKAGQKQLLDYSGEKLQIYVDRREIRSGVARALESAGNDVILTTLEVGDYIVSDRVAIERKTDVDFLDSIIDKDRNIFGQLSDLARTYDRPVLIIEGDNLYAARQIHPNAIRGVLASIATDFGIPIISTRDAEDTAALIQVIAKREQVDEKRTPSLHGRKTAMTLSEQQEYIISSMSNIGPVAARKLLQHFGSVESVMRAGPDELMEVESIGPKTAQRIREVVGSVYKG
ncbi:MAG: 3'-flap repair endonuclease Xpf [ANME-2 cluster archaeon]|nr:3'-flap repair endonuclease Xpf [ANME-2 cluster archaeon]